MRKRGDMPAPDVAVSPSGAGCISTDDTAALTGRPADPSEPVETADPYSAARAIALRQLAMRPRSRAELRARMDQKQGPAGVAEAVLDRLEEVRLVDDAAFAQGWVRSRQTTRGLARRTLAHELRTKGVDDDTARAALDGLDPDEEAATARRLVDRRLASTRRLDRVARTRRLAGMLARKGYPSGLAMRVIREALDSDSDSEAAATPPW